MRFKLYTLSFFLILSYTISAQQNKLNIIGEIYSEDGKPVPYASISLVKDGLGTICNQSGQFSLLIPSNHKDDHILITMMGFEPLQVALTAFKPSSILRITLKQKTAQLQEVIVRPLDPVQLLQQAIAKIPSNYYDQPHILNGFYRVDTKKGDNHIMLSEAVFDVFNPDYTSGKKSKFHLVKMRSIQDDQASHGLDLGLTPNSIYEYDIIKEVANCDLLNKEGLKNHDFKFRGTTSYNGVEAYLVSFDQKDGLKKSRYKGRLWLDANSLAFIAFEYQLSPKGIEFAQYGNAATRALLKLLGMQIDVKKETFLIRYKQFGNKWILSDVRNDHTLRLKAIASDMISMRIFV